MRLGEFIRANSKAISAEWEKFAGTLLPEEDFNSFILRNSIDEFLVRIAEDMEGEQSAHQQSEKSKGNTSSKPIEDVSEKHVTDRIRMGVTSQQLISEFRALRASVIHLWQKDKNDFDMTDFYDLTRFNECIDETIAESEARFAKKIDQSRELFLGILAHDLRNPLAAISGAADVIQRSSSDSRDTLLANQILVSAGHMKHMVNDLMELTRIKLGGGILLSRSKTDMHGLCLKAIAEMKTAYPDRIFRSEVEEDLIGEWDGPKISQVLSNLLGNAVQHGSPDSQITLTARSVNGEVELRVHNIGPVIPKKSLPKLFDRFVQGKSGMVDREPFGNIGLGLYIAKEIVIAHDGTIGADSSQETGTTFWALLPQAAPPSGL